MPDTSRLVIGVAGRIGSGKTEIARFLEREMGFQYLRYSFVLAEWRKTDPTAKGRLQEVGWEVMSGGEGQRELNRRLIAQIGRGTDFTVDGLRHPIDHESLKLEFGSHFALVYIDTPALVRFARLRHRFKAYDEFLAADGHPVERNIDSLKELSSVVLAGNDTPEQLGKKLMSLISLLRKM